MEHDNPVIAEIRVLAEAVCNGSITPEQCARLNALLPTDEEAAMAYAVYLRMHGLLCWHWQDQAAPAAQDVSPPAAAFPAERWPSAMGFLSQTAPFSYMVATVVMAVLLLGAWAYKINHGHNAYVDNNRSTETSGRSELVFIGRVTGLKNCRWSATATPTVIGASVPRDREYTLISGLMEITYNSGARVILEGPCTFKVDSDAGGYLALGKLTANIRGQRAEIRELRSEDRGQKSPNPQSPIPNPFFVRTPTALITDLGTEFGVEVAENNETTLRVFQGVVKVEIENGVTKNLRAGESVLVKTDESRQVRFAHATHLSKFVRHFDALPDQRAEDAYIRAVLADQPLAYWPLNEPAGSRWFRDLSENRFTGAAMGTVCAGAAGPLSGQSRAVALDGGGYIDIGRQDRFALSKNFTLEAWVYIDGLEWKETENNNARIFSVGAGEGRYQSTGWTLGYKVKQDSRMPYCVFARYGVSSDKIDGADIPSARWTHLGFVFDGDKTVRLYLDGAEQGAKDVGSPALQGPSWVAIGWGANLGGTYWRGRLAHVAVYDEALDGKCFEKHLLSVQEKNKVIQNRDDL